MNFIAEMSSRIKIVEDNLNKLTPPEETYPQLIHQAMRYSLMAGGKRLRPVLTLAAAEAVGCEPQVVMPTACAIELIHTYSLIHDDLPAMDNDDFRRGKLTNHKKFDEATAILAGDALLTHAFQLIAENVAFAPADAVVQVIREMAMACGSKGLIGGQIVDTVSENHKIDEKTMQYIHAHKTGALFVASVRSGAILGGASSQQLASLTCYAENLGLAFQIIDDILDLTGETEKLGKPVGSDLKNNKCTYPSLYGIQTAREKAKKVAEKALESLAVFGSKAEFLRQCISFIINRDH